MNNREKNIKNKKKPLFRISLYVYVGKTIYQQQFHFQSVAPSYECETRCNPFYLGFKLITSLFYIVECNASIFYRRETILRRSNLNKKWKNKKPDKVWFACLSLIFSEITALISFNLFDQPRMYLVFFFFRLINDSNRRRQRDYYLLLLLKNGRSINW